MKKVVFLAIIGVFVAGHVFADEVNIQIKNPMFSYGMNFDSSQPVGYAEVFTKKMFGQEMNQSYMVPMNSIEINEPVRFIYFNGAGSIFSCLIEYQGQFYTVNPFPLPMR